MRDYDELVKSMRCCAEYEGCLKCDRFKSGFTCAHDLLNDAADVLERITPVMAEYRLQPVEAVMFPENAIKNELAGKILSELLKHPESYTLQRRDDPFMNDCVFRMTVDVLTLPPKEVE